MGKSLELRHLRAILATADTGSLHRAAQRLETSQPALSRLVREAEERIGLKLFERNAQGSQATAAGALVQQIARRVGADLACLQTLANEGRWHLRVGCIPRALDQIVPRLLHHVPAQLADRVQIDLHENDSLALMASLQRAELDIAVLSLVAQEPAHLLSRELYKDRNVFVCGSPGPEQNNRPLGPGDLARHPFAAPAPGTPSRLEFDHYWRQHGVPPPACRMATRTYDAIASVLPGTSLLAVMPHGIATRHAANGTLRILAVTHPLPERPIHVVWHQHALQPLTDQVIELIQPAQAEFLPWIKPDSGR